jgi:hypothetical protein
MYSLLREWFSNAKSIAILCLFSRFARGGSRQPWQSRTRAGEGGGLGVDVAMAGGVAVAVALVHQPLITKFDILMFDALTMDFLIKEC